jgi:hypothetical protein
MFQAGAGLTWKAMSFALCRGFTERQGPLRG